MEGNLDGDFSLAVLFLCSSEADSLVLYVCKGMEREENWCPGNQQKLEKLLHVSS